MARTNDEDATMTAEQQQPLDELAAELYETLRRIAGRALWKGSRLDPTDLVHHAWVKLANWDKFETMPRAHFLALCATIMRRVAVDEGRRRLVERRHPERITLSGIAEDENVPTVDLLALDSALDQLEKVDERWARIIELRFFAGLSGDEVALALGLSRRTVAREWTLARAWLRRKLG
ncbi:MAG: RNA polymerase sigma-70 factor (ECF subfamily) [Pseudohongiellaceae bacterium]|jgi:RNA polymerase sigma-70 factor (ECF subfamily)